MLTLVRGGGQHPGLCDDPYAEAKTGREDPEGVPRDVNDFKMSGHFANQLLVVESLVLVP